MAAGVDLEAAEAIGVALPASARWQYTLAVRGQVSLALRMRSHSALPACKWPACKWPAENQNPVQSEPAPSPSWAPLPASPLEPFPWDRRGKNRCRPERGAGSPGVSWRLTWRTPGMSEAAVL